MDLATIEKTTEQIGNKVGKLHGVIREVRMGKVQGVDMPPELKTALLTQITTQYDELKLLLLRLKTEMT